MLQALHRQKRRRAAPFTFVNLGSMDNLYQGRRESAGRANEEGSRETPVAADSALLAVQPMTLKRILQPLNADEDGAEGTAQGASYDEAVAATDFGFDDAVSQGLLPLFTARRLFHFFITHLNMWSMIIDPDLHTHDYVRRTSPFLYSVILHLAARFSVDEVYGHAAGEPERVVQVPTVTETECRHLQVIAKNHAATVFIDGDRTVEAVQAFFLLATWKEHDDALSYVQSGFAFRLAMDMELGKGVPKSLQKLALSEQEQGRSQQVRRLIELLRNRERCCLQLFVQDRSQAFHYIRHFTFSVLEPVISGAFEWYLQPGAKPWDVFLCASVECRKVQSKYQGIMTSVASAVADRDAAAAAIEGDLDAWHSTWARRLDEEHEQWTRAHDGALPPHAPQMSFMQASMALWRDSIKLHLVADLLEQDLRTTQSSSPSLRHYAHDYEPGATSNTGSGTATPRRIVNLVGLPAFSLCVRAARGVISALCSLPPAVLRHAPDSIHLLADHTGLFLCGMVCIRSDPPLSSEYLRTTLSAVERMRDALWQATIQESDSVALHARYLDSLAEVLRPTKKAPKPLSRPVDKHQQDRHKTARTPRSGKQQQRVPQPAAIPDGTSTDQTHTGHGGPSRGLPDSAEYDDSASVLSSLGSMADLAAMTSVSPDVVLTAPADNWFESVSVAREAQLRSVLRNC